MRPIVNRTVIAFAPTFAWSTVAAFTIVALLALLLSGVAAATAALARDAAGANVERITLERGACFGWCPAYRLVFDADGSAQYEGQAFVRERGNFEAPLNRPAFLRFAAVLARRGFFVSRQATVSVMDAPSTTISIAFRDGTVATTSAFTGFRSDPLADDVDEGALFIDGFAGHICGWTLRAKPATAAPTSSYAPFRLLRAEGRDGLESEFFKSRVAA